MTKDSPVLPYMFPKYTSREVVGEEFEAKMLLMPNNQRTLVVATLIGSGIIPTDHRHLDVSSALQLWLSEISGSGGQQLTEQLSHLHRAVSNFVPAPLGATDELIVAADHRHLFTWTWQWDARAHRLLDHCQSPRLPHDLGSYGFGGECVLGAKIKRGSRHTGCIRYENNRKRWVVDLSVNGCRMQKCFHENLYGFVGGLQEARRWRLDYIRSAHNEFDIETEERIVNDLVDKIIAMDSSLHAELLDALREPVPGYEHILDARSLRSIVDGRLAALGFLQP
ncbi:AP2 domain protein [Babesia caballi]|uniref:AP2 domain protein n=1 Tax=Babesia caballi TaxID=5871 RepID=A0AAV4LZ44_BABCB|nr:AP2 domain protein [Babesia caballi]